MENAVDALKIAFAVFIFVMALSITIYMFTMAKETSDLVLQASDVTEYMEYTDLGTANDRIVGLETIIPTLYKYFDENYTVIFRDSEGEPMTLYESKVKNWSPNYKNKYYTDSNSKNVCSFDAEEETSRYEPWAGNKYYSKKNLDMFLSGQIFESPSGNGINYKYSENNGWGGNKGFIEQFKNSKFIESLGEYTYSSTNGGSTNAKETKKRVIIYTLSK